MFWRSDLQNVGDLCALCTTLFIYKNYYLMARLPLLYCTAIICFLWKVVRKVIDWTSCTGGILSQDHAGICWSPEKEKERKSWISYNCGHGSNWNTWIQSFVEISLWVSEQPSESVISCSFPGTKLLQVLLLPSTLFSLYLVFLWFSFPSGINKWQLLITLVLEQSLVTVRCASLDHIFLRIVNKLLSKF